MQNLYQIFVKFLTIFKSKSKDNQKKEQSENNTEHIASLFFGLLKSDTDTIDIKCLLPNVETKSIEDITNIAEKYAQLLVLINTENLNKNISRILETYKIKNQDNYKALMLIDSIISFWEILYTAEHKKHYQRFRATQPLIKPSEAFKVK